jgi:2-dehydropantoate 2-reductase
MQSKYSMMLSNNWRLRVSSGKKIAIIGAGAIGRLVGGILAHAGEDVTLVSQKRHIEEIKMNGLIINGVAGDFNVRIKAAEHLDFKPDIVFIAVKTQNVEEVCLEIKSIVSGSPIVMMQNGVRSAHIASSILGKKNLISCILLLNAKFFNNGVVTYANRKPIVIGDSLGKSKEILVLVQSLLNNVSDTVISNNITGAQWTKLFINAMSNSIDAMTGLTLGEYAKCYSLRKIAVQILKEALEIVEKADIKLEKLPGIPILLYKAIIKLPTPIAALILRFALISKGNSEIITSTLQSIRNGKKTEIDYINGEFVNIGKRIGSQTPFNSKVVELIHKIERTHIFFTPKELSYHFSIL